MAARVLQAAMKAKGQLTVPVSMRRKYGLDEGVIVAFVATEEGLLLKPQRVVGMEALEEIGRLLSEQGVDLETLIESGRDIRGDLVAERYGLVDTDKP